VKKSSVGAEVVDGGTISVKTAVWEAVSDVGKRGVSVGKGVAGKGVFTPLQPVRTPSKKKIPNICLLIGLLLS
jgi:hypothetical protein